MRRIWFVFKIIESFLGLCCLVYHAAGFLNFNNIQNHYTYVAVFSGFSLMSMFGCLSICLKEPVSQMREGLMSILAAISFIFISMNSMYHAEKDFHLMYLSSDIRDQIEDEYREETDLLSAPHPFFKYSKAQSVAALTCGCLYLLHAILAFDLAIVRSEEIYDESGSESLESDESGEIMTFYVFGRKVHNWLNQFDWFSNLAETPFIEKEYTETNLRINSET